MSTLFVGAALLDRWSEGETMTAIARDIGTTRERVRQLIDAYLSAGHSTRDGRSVRG